MKGNPEKCHFICSTVNNINLTVENQKIFNSQLEKRLDVRFDSNLP